MIKWKNVKTQFLIGWKELPHKCEVKDVESLNLKAKILKKECGDSPEGQEKFNNWLKVYRKYIIGKIDTVAFLASLKGIEKEISEIDLENNNEKNISICK